MCCWASRYTDGVMNNAGAKSLRAWAVIMKEIEYLVMGSRA